MDTKLLFQRIEEFDTITLFRHVSPDADALGSQFGLKQWIVDHYPNKQVQSTYFVSIIISTQKILDKKQSLPICLALPVRF